MGASTMSSVDISIFHTVFNITCTVVLLPFAEKLVWVSGKLVPGRGNRGRAGGQRSKKDGEALRQQSTWQSALCAGNGSAGGFRDGACDLSEPGACACSRVRRKSSEGAEGIRAGKDINSMEKILTEFFGGGR